MGIRAGLCSTAVLVFYSKLKEVQSENIGSLLGMEGRK